MKTKNNILNNKNLYIFFVVLSLIIFFFSTDKTRANTFNIKDIELSKPFEINFDKKEVLDKGFKNAFFELISLITSSSDQEKMSQVRLNEIKGMIESFSIKEEKFIDEIYYVNMGVTFNKKKIFNFLETKNIFPSIPSSKKLLFIPIIIDEKKKDLLIFSNNKFYNQWNKKKESYHLIQYILPTEDLEDLNLIKKKFNNIEEYDFREITNKYNLDSSIIALIFKNEKNVRILSRINVKDNVSLKNQSFSDIDFNNDEQIQEMINFLKVFYEDYWKKNNQINTSIKLVLNIKVESLNSNKIKNFEKILSEIDTIYNFYITKFNKDYFFYKVVFNGTTNAFLKFMSDKNYEFDTQNIIWKLK